MATTLSNGQQAKLRKSCDVCATTKVGCSKEKPTCSRCAKRGLVCSYSAARRAGRSAKTLMRTTGTLSDLPSPPFEMIDPFGTDTDAPLASGFDTHHHRTFDTGTDSSENIFLLNDQEGSGMLPSLPHDLSDLDDFLASMMAHPSYTLQDGKGSSAIRSDLKQASLTSHSTRTSRSSSLFLSSSSSDDVGIIAPAHLHSGEGLESHIGFDSAFGEYSTNVDEISPTCRCFAQAASLSSRLAGRLSNTETGKSCEFDKLQTALSQTQQDIDHIRTILECSCSNDGDLIVALSLVLLKAITWYTSAAQLVSNELSNAESRSASTADIDVEDQQRLAAQLILSKLMDVQILIEILSQRLQNILGERDDVEGKGLEFSSNTPLISTELAYMLHADLCKRLQTLSQAIIEQLQQV